MKKKRRAKRPTPEWVKNLRVGDVLEAPDGSYRALRKITWTKRGVGFFFFTAMRPSRTTRCYAIYCVPQIREWKPTGSRIALNTKFDREILEEINRTGGLEKVKLFDCDVRYAI